MQVKTEETSAYSLIPVQNDPKDKYHFPLSEVYV